MFLRKHYEVWSEVFCRFAAYTSLCHFPQEGMGKGGQNDTFGAKKVGKIAHRTHLMTSTVSNDNIFGLFHEPVHIQPLSPPIASMHSISLPPIELRFVFINATSASQSIGILIVGSLNNNDKTAI